MHFEHTEDRRMLADTLDRFLADQYPIEARHAAAASELGFSETVWRGLADIGAIGALFPEAVGGFGGDAFDVTVVFDSLGKGLAIEPFLGALVVGQAIAAVGTDEQKAWLSPLLDGSTVAALAHDEAGGHYELAHVALRAERTPAGYMLDGHKGVVVHGEQAGLLLVSARTAGAVDDENGLSLFLVPANAPGLTRQGYGRVDGGRAAELHFNQVSVPVSALLGAQGQGLAVLERAVGWGVLALCAEAVGAMDVVKQMTLDYLRTRQQFGVPIGSFQALQHRMADVLLEIEQARSAVINAAAAMGAERGTRERALSAAKYSIGRIGTRVAEECIQLHGGIGMTWELPLAHYAKRLVMIDHQLGDEDHHLARYMALAVH
ncbi:MAG: acyl-CoA dehydrogenase family protein [Hydrogenophaga sp.]|uniref:acyl-CoA dehydrogenase family protein n=1 Tax=Hydrogenophaga sp. TaxID=1904254 RepID=UPI001D9B043A|nr:acyl-CoA dehydrogenase family protein [Hydrogenophaga sp.]MBX3610582.1 acyl-CoA dehydrogenase family protein [Hydrogenophaga sp.]